MATSDAPRPLRIGERWSAAGDGTTFAVREPATGGVIATVARAGVAETNAAIAAAQAALPTWRGTPAARRAQLCTALADGLLARRDALARERAREGGTALATALSEVDYAAGFFRFYADAIRRVRGRAIAHPDPRRRLRVEHVAVGVVAAITPWNLPLAAPAKKVAAALAAGCTIVLKPSELTPLSALALARIADDCGLPPGVLNVVCGDAEAIGGALCAHPAVRLLAFTGSTAVGRTLMAACAPTVKRVALELGGNAPFIVLADADLARAADDLAALKLGNAGQICVTANRVLVERAVHERFVALLCERLARAQVGDPLAAGTTMGPLIHHRAAQRVARLVDEAIAGGARVALGHRPAPVDAFFPPTVVTGVDNGMAIAQQEVFGPVAPIITVADEAEAIAVANATPYGLAAFVYTQDEARGARVAEALEAGVVGINDPRPIIPASPFGGVKQSGIGREGGVEGLHEYLEVKLVGRRCAEDAVEANGAGDGGGNTGDGDAAPPPDA